MSKLRIQDLKGFNRLMNSAAVLTEVYPNDVAEVYTTVDLPWRVLSKVRTIQLVDGLFESRNIFYRSPRYKYHFSHFVFTTDIKSMNYFKRIGIGSSVYIPAHSQIEISYDSDGPILVTTSNTPYENSQDRDELIFCMGNIVEQLTQLGENVVYRIKDEYILSALKIKEEDNFLQDFPSGLKGMISTPTTLIMEALRKGIPVLQIFYRLDPIFVQSGWMISVKEKVSTDFISSFIQPEKWRLEFQKNEVVVPLETSKLNPDYTQGELRISPGILFQRALIYILKVTFPGVKKLRKRF